MPKKSPYQDPSYKSLHSSKLYTRKPIHHRDEEKEETVDEEEEEEAIDCNMHQKRELYPNLEEDLSLIRGEPRKRNDSEKRKKNSNEPKPSVKSEKTGSQKSSSSVFNYVISILLFIVAVIGFFIYNVPKKPVENDVTVLVANMQNHFKEQGSLTFKILKLALMKVVNDKHEPSAPAIFTIIANKGAENTASDFSIYLAKALAPGQFVSINESVLSRDNPEHLKFKIDNKIRSKLEKEILNVVIVDRLNDIPIDAAMIFHGFCDHESAPYKRAVYLFIVHLGKSIPENSTTKHIDAVAMDSLRNIWRTSTDDLVDSLITRITVNVVNIR